jgi:negative regulator of flagellin synthesis FlgM
MKINKIYTQIINKNVYNSKDERTDKIHTKSKPYVNVEISKTAKELAMKMEQLEDENISERVEAIRKSILDGTYKVSPEDIADKILAAIENQKGNIK